MPLYILKANLHGNQLWGVAIDNSNTTRLYSQRLQNVLYRATMHWAKRDVTFRNFNSIFDVNYPIKQCNFDVRWSNIVFAINTYNVC